MEPTRRKLDFHQFSWSRSRGFTFIELMVVLFVVGLIISLVAINIDEDADSLVRTEARRFAALVRLAADESIVQGKPMGIDLLPDGMGYQFLIFKNGKWILSITTDELRQRKLQHEVRVKILQSESSLVDVTNGDNSEEDASSESTENGESVDPTPPEIILTPVGIITSFEFLFYLDKATYSVKSNQDSDISVVLYNAEK